jgi:uncharacterized membrane protein
MMRLDHYASILIGKEPVPMSLSKNKHRKAAHVNAGGTNKAKKLAKQLKHLKVKAKRWK